MAFKIINGRNGGYPCIPELNERESAELVNPVYEFIFRAVSGNYPYISQLSSVSAEPEKPFPECMPVCFGENVNDGYPWIKELKAIVMKTESFLYYNGRRVQRMYFNDKPVSTALCNEKKVFDIFYDRMRIV